MRRLLIARLFVLVAITLTWLPFTIATPVAQAHGGTHVAVTTRSYDTNRNGANLQETILTPANVTAGSFGKLYERTVDGQIYAQPLYLADLEIPNQGVHNVVYVATQQNNLYAFDADDPAAASPLWQVNLGQYAESVVNGTSDFGWRYNSGRYLDIQPNVGITSTPVIDTATNTIYVVTFERLGSARPFTYRHRLHALDLATGAEKFRGPTVIAATYPGTTPDAVNSVITFQSVKQLQRAALLLNNGIVYVAFAGYADTDPYHGWILGYDAATLAQRYVFNTTPTLDPANGSQPDANDGEGGIWMSGQGLSADANGDMYVVVGNGNVVPGGSNYGNSVVRLTRPQAGTQLTVGTAFTPYNYNYLNQADQDLGVTGAVLLPGNTVVAGSKEGKLYVLDRTTMMPGGIANNDTNARQSFLATKQLGDHIHGSPVYWNGRLYLWSEKDRLRAFAFNGSLFTTAPVMTGSYELPSGMPGGIVSLSANGNDATTGVLWATTPIGNANPSTRLGELRAYNASATGQQNAIWSSADNPADRVGNFAKFNPPMVADGKVFVGSFSSLDDPATPANEFSQDKLVVYGLLKPAIVAQPAPYTVTYNTAAQLSVRATGRGPLQYQWYQGLAGDPSMPIVGATAATYTTVPLTTPTRFWVNVVNQVNGQSMAQSESALIGVSAIDTQATLTSLPATAAVYGQPVALTATVSKLAQNPTVLTGTVTLYDTGVALGSGNIDPSGSATLTGTNLTVGNHSIAVTYNGVPGMFTQANSATISVAVSKASTSATVTIAPVSSAVAGQNLTLTAQVAAVAPSALTPNGSVQFMNGNMLLGTATLDAGGQAQIVVPASTVGAFVVSAAYLENSNWLASQSAPQSIQVSQASTTTTLRIAPNQPVAGQTVTLTVQVMMVAPATGVPTGSVQFMNGTMPLGTVQLDASGQAQLVLPAGISDAADLSANYLGTSMTQSSQGNAQVVVRYAVWLPLTTAP